MKPFIIGVGKAGCKIADLFLDEHQGILLDTDKLTLNYFKTRNRLLIGEKSVDGNGTGRNPQLGREIFDGERYRIVEFIDDVKKDFDCFFIFSSLGGGTGGGVSVLIEELKKSYTEPVYHVGILPSEEDPEKLIINFASCFKDIAREADSVLPVDNDLLKGRMGLLISLNKINTKIYNYFQNIFEVGEYTSALGSNVLGVQDVINTLEGVASVGLGVHEINLQPFSKREIDKPELIVALTAEAVTNTLFTFDAKDSKKALVIVSGPKRYMNFLGSIPARLWLEKNLNCMEVRGGDIPSPKKENFEVCIILSGIRKSERIRYLYQLGKILKNRGEYSTKMAEIYEKIKKVKKRLSTLEMDLNDISNNLKKIGEANENKKI